MISRRDFLTYASLAIGGSAALHPFNLFADAHGSSAPRLIVGADDKVCLIDLAARSEQHIVVSFRVHACLPHPAHDKRFIAVEKWGKSACEVSFTDNIVTQRFESMAGMTYSGHGFFSPSGDELFLTMDDYTDGKGYLVGFDTRTYEVTNKQQVTAGNLHDCIYQKDGTVLIVSDGLKFVPGMQTLLGERVEPGAVVKVNMKDYGVVDRYEISDDEQALGHIKMTQQGHLFAISAPRGIKHSRHKAAIYFMKSGETKLKRVELPPELVAISRGEFLSIAIDEIRHVAVVTNPNSRSIVMLNALTGEYMHHHHKKEFRNASYDPVSQKIILGGKDIAALNTATFALEPYPVSNLHTPIPTVKNPGIWNGAHSLIV